MNMTEEQLKEHLKSKGWWNCGWQQGSELLIERWRDFVTTVEQEERTRNWLIDDYWISLEVRELIHEVGRDGAVKEEDDRFRAILTATDIKHHHHDRENRNDFWNYGYPKNATGFFYEQIRRHIL